jgi:5-methylthioadenosine/S-adenosylhomocysteine deaminase
MTLVDEMWLATLIHKGRKLDPTVVPAHTVLEMVTCQAAEALLWQEEIGSLEAGKKADLVVIDPNTPTMLPMHDPVANMVNAMQNRNIDSVMCDGQWLMRNGEILVVDEAEVMAEAKARASAIAERAGLKLPPRFKVIE